MYSGTGSGLCVMNDNTVIAKWKRRLNINNTVYQAELTAIQKAINIASKFRTQVQIHSDSMPSLQALGGGLSRHPIVQKIQRQILNLTPTARPSLSWVPAHTSIVGNEIADTRAKDAAMNSSLLEFYLPLPRSQLKRSTFLNLLTKWQDLWNNSTTGRRTYNFLSKPDTTGLVTSSALTTFLSGHGPFPDYLFRFGLKDTDLCNCGQRGSPDHFLFHCELTRSHHFHIPAERHRGQWAQPLLKHNGSHNRLIRILHICNELYAF
ncbi:uncharacterized protein LOC118180735 [Stegodyphus dumicola]|uniref:uncharacterized protein LOC118180735 n=1 Tax=Stegodyphus dumicola TaxID=202533 RepID=UPI0015A88135|nr:uncharacterized protein LOC118180735 [Stegodyphus dumicola]